MATATPRRPSALIGAFPTLRGNAAVLDLWRDVVRGMTDPVDAAFVRAFQVSTLARPVPASFLDQAVTESLKVPARIWREALEDMLAHDQSASLGRITAPTLIVWGDQDGFASRQDQDRLAGAIAGARLRVH
ncbi:MAG: alpha/beta fold hydrolase, partial [Acetobacteraceae bacterium]